MEFLGIKEFPASTQMLLIFICTIALTLYFLGIMYAGKKSYSEISIGSSNSNQTQVPEVIHLYLTGVSGALATFIGMIFGFKRVNEVAGGPPMIATEIDWLQTVAAYSYVISLLVALYYYYKCKVFSDLTAPIIQNLSKSMLGLFVGVLVIALNVPQSKTPPNPPGSGVTTNESVEKNAGVPKQNINESTKK